MLNYQRVATSKLTVRPWQVKGLKDCSFPAQKCGVFGVKKLIYRRVYHVSIDLILSSFILKIYHNLPKFSGSILIIDLPGYNDMED